MLDYFFLKIILFMRYGDTIVKPGNPQMAIWYMRISRWISKATNTHSEYVIIIAFPMQQRLLERASMLFYTYNGIICRINYEKEKIEITGIRKEARKTFVASRLRCQLNLPSPSKRVAVPRTPEKQVCVLRIQSGTAGNWINLIPILQNLVTDLN
jgi:hypothetical protein